MDDRTQMAAAQLSRMRGMTAMYHRRFFLDVNITTVLILALLVAGWFGAEPAFLVVPVVALMGAVQTAFDASYLIFARWYAAYLERYLNHHVGDRIHVAAEMEAAYLFPLGSRKIVTIPVAGGFSWFSFVTIFYTVLGAFAYLFGLILGWDTLVDAPVGVAVLYSFGLFGVTLASFVVGVWWFATGVGERRLQQVLDTQFGGIPDASGATEGIE
ncbi:MAG: hypothetical protein WCC01_01095 [Acidimicrobiia bacterium]